MTNSINYEEIDSELRNLIKELNNAKLTTKYCCFGHRDEAKLYIMFDESINKEELLEWYKELTRFNINYNGRLLLNYSVRWNEMYNDPKFIGNWVLSFEGSTSEREGITYAMLWRTIDYIKQTKRNDTL